MKMRWLGSLAHAHRLLVSLILGIGTLSVAAVAIAAIVSGTSTTGVSGHVTYTLLTLNRPTVSAGDVMIAGIAIQDGSIPNVTAPSGWTQILRTDNDVNVTLITYRKVAGASEPSTYTWTIDEQTKATGGITPYSGVDTASPVDASAGNTGFGPTATTSAISTSNTNEMVIAVYANDVAKSFSTPTGMTEKYDLPHTNSGPTIAYDEIVQATSGTVTSKSSTITGNKSRNWAAQTIALHKSAPIHFDAGSSNHSSSPGTSMTTSHTVGGTNRILFVSASVGEGEAQGPGDVITGVTYNGVPLTLLGKVGTNNHEPGNPIETYLYYLLAPDVGTHDVVVSYPDISGTSRNVWVASASYTGVAQSAPEASAGAANNVYSSSATGTVTTISDNAWVVMGSYNGGNASAGSGTTVRAVSPTLTRQALSDSGGPVSPPGSVTLTVNGDTDWTGTITAAIAPAE
jgi:hypothetical protein